MQDFIPSLSFEWMQPQSPYPNTLLASIFLQTLTRLGFNFERWNTKFKDKGSDLDFQISTLCKIPKASTYAVGLLINQIVDNLKSSEVFLNIGVWHGFTFLSGLIHHPYKKCIAVDNFSVNKKIKSNGDPEYHGLKKYFYQKVDQWARHSFLKRFEHYKSRQHQFYEMDYVDYLKNVHQDPIGFYIYDAQHRYHDQLQALQLAEPFFTKGCIILIDDTNAADNYQATLDFMIQSKFNYRILLDEKTYCNRHPTFWNGLTIFQKMD